MKNKYADLGSISSGTMRPEDLIPCFASELESLMKNREPSGAMSADWRDSFAKLISEAEAIEDFYECEDAGDILAELFDALQAFAPPYAYFGAHPGDGADYGFWLGEDFQQDIRDNGGLEVDDLSAVPADYCGEVLHVSDHGNATLYAADHGKFSEIWGVV